MVNLGDKCKAKVPIIKIYEDFASDESDDDLIFSTRTSLESQVKNTNLAQINVITKEINNLQKIVESQKNAMNKDEMIEEGLHQINKIDTKFFNTQVNVHDVENKLVQNMESFYAFNLPKKIKKRVQQCNSAIEKA